MCRQIIATAEVTGNKQCGSNVKEAPNLKGTK